MPRNNLSQYFPCKTKKEPSQNSAIAPPPRQNPFAPINFHYRERTQKEDFKQILSLSSNSRLPGLMNRQSLFADINPRVPGVLFGWLNLNREGPIKE